MAELFERRYEFADYSVIIRNHELIYIIPIKDHTISTYHIPAHFDITIDKEEDGGKIQINWRDSYGSEMHFIYYDTSKIKELFDFIARGFNVKFNK